MLERLYLQGFRNYAEQWFQPGSGVNVVVGENGSGKTSLLEAIYLLSSGRSFRSGRLQNLVMAGHDLLTVFAQVHDQGGVHRLGLSRDAKGLVDVRKDGERTNSLAELAKCFPVQVLHPGTVGLIEGGASERRRQYDWALFHVEPEFLPAWRNLRQALEQRNQWLKLRRFDAREWAIWDQQVSESSVRIDAARHRYLKQLEGLFRQQLEQFSRGLPPLSLRLYSGWSQQESIAQALQSSRELDAARGFTSKGAHRADLVISLASGPARELLSRGQKKIAAYALVLAQVALLRSHGHKDCLMLVDDITAELDSDNAQRVMTAVAQVVSQSIITTLDSRLVPKDPADSYRVFHVEHGKLAER